MKKTIPTVAVLVLFGSFSVVACSSADSADGAVVPALGGENVGVQAEHEILRGNGVHSVRNEAAARTTSRANVTDHGGRVVPTMHYYAIYWGAGFEASTQSLYTGFLGGLGQSTYWTTNTQYLRGAANTASYVASTNDATQPPATVTDANVQAEVHKILASGALPYDANGLYFVMTPSSTKVCNGSSCSCSNFCGYHSNYADSSFGTVLYSPIPSAAACPASCGVFTSNATSPNGNIEADEGVSIIAHEAEETQSDALGSAWFDRTGNENADKCAYKYGPTTTLNGAKVNQTWGGTSYLVQMNWSNQISGCAQQGPADGPYTQ